MPDTRLTAAQPFRHGGLRSVSWFARLTAPWRITGDVTDSLIRIERAVDTDIPAQLNRMETHMADQSTLLNDIAAGLSGPLAGSIQALIAENAELRGEDASESAAALNVKTAFDDVAGLFTTTPEVPDVGPLPEPVVDPATPEDGPSAA